MGLGGVKHDWTQGSLDDSTDDDGWGEGGGGTGDGRARYLVTTEIPHRLTDETWREQHLDQPVYRDVAQRRATDR